MLYDTFEAAKLYVVDIVGMLLVVALKAYPIYLIIFKNPYVFITVRQKKLSSHWLWCVVAWQPLNENFGMSSLTFKRQNKHINHLKLPFCYIQMM